MPTLKHRYQALEIEKPSERGLRLSYWSFWKWWSIQCSLRRPVSHFPDSVSCNRPLECYPEAAAFVPFNAHYCSTDCPAHLGSAVPGIGDPQGTTAKYGSTVHPGVVGWTCISFCSPFPQSSLSWLPSSYCLSTQTVYTSWINIFRFSRSLLRSISARSSLRISCSRLNSLRTTPTRSTRMKSVALACLAPLAAATKNIAGLSYANAIPKENLAQDCEYPAYFTIQDFATFTPSASNKTEVNFGCTFRPQDVMMLGALSYLGKFEDIAISGPVIGH